ncbi:hypothetical protein R1flu_020295 [Riccia fluitans]|uniref:Uncharacterized protein n=1 Tax=Riccia fluitans TaxID=41844 RepID=A0ABD1ZLK1_9MARC
MDGPNVRRSSRFHITPGPRNGAHFDSTTYRRSDVADGGDTEADGALKCPPAGRASTLAKFTMLGGQRGFDGTTIEFLQSGVSLGDAGDLLGSTCRGVEIQVPSDALR